MPSPILYHMERLAMCLPTDQRINVPLVEARVMELIEINQATVEAARVESRKRLTAYRYKMRLSDAKRFIVDPIGYEVVHEFLRSGELENHHFTSRLEDDVEFITIGSKNLIVNHNDRSLRILE